MSRGTPHPLARREEDVEEGRDDEYGACGSLGACFVTILLFPEDCVCSLLIALLTVITLPVLGVTCIVVGLVNIDKCELQAWVPKWLIVYGFLMLVGFVTERISSCLDKKKSSSSSSSSSPISSSICSSVFSSFLLVRIVSVTLCLASLAWLTAGNVWVYVAMNRVNVSKTPCDFGLLYTAGLMVILSDAFLALLPLCCFCPRLFSN